MNANKLYPPRWKFIAAHVDSIPIFEREAFIVLLTLLLSCSDLLTIYKTMEALFTQEPVYSWAGGIIVAILLNFIPVFAARAIVKFRKGQGSIIMPIILVATFALIFVLTFNLRWIMRSILFEEDSSQTFNIMSYLAQSESDQGPTDQQNAGALLTGFLPLITSVVCFSFELFSDPLKREKYSLQRKIAGDDYDLMKYEAALAEIEKDWSEIYEEQNERLYNADLARIDAAEETSMNEVRLLMTPYADAPPVINILTQPTMDQEGAEVIEGPYYF